jgi:SAM-dependent methyltransferase
MKYNLKFWKTFYKIRYYPSITKKQTAKEIEFVKELLPTKEYKNILDFICGFGRHSIELAKIGYNIEGFDVDSDSIQQAKNTIRKLKLKNINFYVKDALKFSKKGVFDAAICLYSSIGFLEEKLNEKVFKNFFQSIKKNGRLILDVMNPAWAIKYLIPYSEKTVIHKGRIYFIKHKREILCNPTREKNIIDFLDKKTFKKYTTSYMIRLYFFKELKKIFMENGFKIYKSFGSFEKNKISSNYQRIIIIADKI